MHSRIIVAHRSKDYAHAVQIDQILHKRHIEQGRSSAELKDVQGLTRQSAQTARSRIDKWLSDGLIKADGTRPTGAGPPVDQFAIRDPRVSRMLARNL